MANLVAIHLGDKQADIVAAETAANGSISINRSMIIDLAPLELSGSTETNGSGSAENNSADANSDQQNDSPTSDSHSSTSLNGHSASVNIEQVLNIGIDSSFAAIEPRQAIFGFLKLPFSDQKKLDQTVPLQVQDFIPFEIDEFLIGNWVTGQGESGEFDVVSSLIPERDVSSALSKLKSIGADPKVLTILAGSVPGLTTLCSDILVGTYGLFVFSDFGCAVALVVNDQLRLIRELSTTHIHSSEELFRELRCCVARVEYDHNIILSQLFAFGAQNRLSDLSKGMGQTVTHIDLNSYIAVDESLNLDVNDIAWAVGLFASESVGQIKKLPLVDYRLGKYAYKPAWGNFLAALKEQRIYFFISALIILAWAGVLFLTIQKDLSSIDDAISEKVNQVFPGEVVYSGQEDAFVEGRTQELRDELNDLGALALLSPLESLVELSQAIPPMVDVQIDSIKIREDLTVLGSVPDYTSSGVLQSSLEKDSKKFCDITVTPSKSTGAARVNVTAVINFCD